MTIRRYSLKEILGLIAAGLTFAVLLGIALPLVTSFSLPGPIRALWGSSAPASSDQPRSTHQQDIVVEVPTPESDLRARMRSRYRPEPDARFLEAFRIVHRFLRGDSIPPLKVTYRDGGWTLRMGDRHVADLSEHPRFPAVLEALVDYSRRLQASTGRVRRAGSVEEHPRLEARLRTFYLPDLLKGLGTLRSLAGDTRPHPKAYPYYAARAFTALSMQAFDDVQTADRIPATALAMLAVTRATTHRSLPGTRARLAYFTGYSTHAKQLSKRLPDTDPFRLFVRRRNDRLRALAEGSGHRPEAGYLWMSRLSSLDRTSDWYRAAHRQFERYEVVLPVLKTGVEMRTFDERRDLARALPPLVVMSLAEEVSRSEKVRMIREKAGDLLTDTESRASNRLLSQVLESQTESLVGRFEEGLQLIPSGGPDPLRTAAMKRDLFRGYFFSALYQSALFYMDAYSSVEATQKFSAMLGDTGGGKMASQMQTWTRHLAAHKTGSGSRKDLTRDLRDLDRLGALQLYRTFEAIAETQGSLSPWLMTSARWFFDHLDTRSNHLWMGHGIARSGLMDLHLSVDLLRGVVEADGPRSVQATTLLHHYDQDTRALLKRARDPKIHPAQQSYAVRKIAASEVPDETIRSEFERLVERAPGDWSGSYSDYVDYLEDRGDHQAIIDLVTRWEQHSDTRSGFDYLDTRRHLARAFRERGRLFAAWMTIKPELDSMQNGVLLEATRVLRDMEEYESAFKVIRRARRRYPDSTSGLELHLGLLWRQGHPEKALRVLKGWQYPLRRPSWRHGIGEAFARAYAGRPSEAREAFGLFREAGVSYKNLYLIPMAFFDRGDPKTAYALHQMIEPSGLMNRMRARILDYQFLKAWKGQQEAFSWLREQKPESWSQSWSVRASIALLARQEFKLLWKLFPELETQPGHYSLWLYRTGAMYLRPELMERHGDRVREHYRKIGGDGHPYDLMARVLLRQQPFEDLRNLMQKEKKRRCEAAYFLGLRALSNRNFERANDWFRVSVETFLSNNGEYHWASRMLHHWIEFERSPKVLQGRPMSEVVPDVGSPSPDESGSLNH